MKHFNEKHEAILTSKLQLIDNHLSPAEGEVVPHKHSVQHVEFYTPHNVGEGEMYIRVFMNKEMVMELAKQIEKIEAEEVQHPFDNLPF